MTKFQFWCFVPCKFVLKQGRDESEEWDKRRRMSIGKDKPKSNRKVTKNVFVYT